MSNEQHAQEIAMLRAEVEMLMAERQALLRATGAAAVFVANLDSESLPEDTYAVADILAHALNDLSEDTLRDALELVQPSIESARAEQKERCARAGCEDGLKDPSSSQAKIGLILTGGGARAAYQVGFLRAVSHLL